MLEGRVQLGVEYPILKMASMIGSYLPGAPGGLFAPSLAIGAGIGNALHLLFGQMQLPMLVALGMVGYLAAVTQSPITAFIIVIEMINGHALVISLMATALISSQVSKFLLRRFMKRSLKGMSRQADGGARGRKGSPETPRALSGPTPVPRRCWLTSQTRGTRRNARRPAPAGSVRLSV